MNNIIYVAISKETGRIMVGQKGQSAFGDKANLARSVGYRYGGTARRKGLKPNDLYYIQEVNVVGKPQGEDE